MKRYSQGSLTVIAGGAGLVGSNLVDRLMEVGDRVISVLIKSQVELIA
jgi:nucleoside-diphosphate-sugar epimerase